MLKKLVTFVGLSAAIAATTPALSATGLNCINSGYSPADEAVLAAFTRDFSLNGKNSDELTTSIVKVIAVRGGACSAENNWPVDALTQAVFFKMAAMMEQALVQHSVLSQADSAKFDALYAGQGHAIFRRLLGPMLEAQLTGDTTYKQSKADETALGLQILAAGLPNDDKSTEYVGAVIGARMMGEIAAEKFQKL